MTNVRFLRRHIGPLRNHSKQWKFMIFCNVDAGSQDRAGQSRTEHAENLGNRRNTNNFRRLGRWDPRWSTAGLTRPQVEFAGGHAKTIGGTIVFRLRKHNFRSPSSLLVRAGHIRTHHAENLGNRWKINNSTNTASKHSKEEIRSGNFRITFQRL